MRSRSSRSSPRSRTATSVARSTSSNRLAGLPNTCHTFGKGKYVIASDLPLQGSLRPLAVQIVAAIRLELKQMNFKIGDKTITYASCDDSTAAKGSWDSQTCTNNANGYKTVKNFLGLIGTFNSGCAEIIAPILNRAPGGGIAMVSPANTYVGLTSRQGCPVSRASTSRRASAITRVSQCRTTSRARPTRRSFSRRASRASTS